MLAFIPVTIDIIFLIGIMGVCSALGFLINKSRINKQKKAVARLEAEMLQSHAEILRLQKELSDKDSLHSKTPIFSIHDTSTESSKEQAPGVKKVGSGRGKSTS